MLIKQYIYKDNFLRQNTSARMALFCFYKLLEYLAL